MPTITHLPLRRLRAEPNQLILHFREKAAGRFNFSLSIDTGAWLEQPLVGWPACSLSGS